MKWSAGPILRTRRGPHETTYVANTIVNGLPVKFEASEQLRLHSARRRAGELQVDTVKKTRIYVSDRPPSHGDSVVGRGAAMHAQCDSSGVHRFNCNE